MKYISVLAIIIFGVIAVVFLNQKADKSQTPLQEKSTPLNENVQTKENTPATGIVAENLDTPWAIAFLPDNSLLVTERPGRVQHIGKNGNIELVATIQNAKEIGEGGLLGIAIHPKFPANNYVYLYYTYSSNGNDTLNKVVRMTYKSNKLSDEKIIVDKIPGASNHNGGRIKFGPDDYLYITTGDAQNPSQAQKTDTLGGKILRVMDDGKPASGNPFNNLIYSYGHRNPQGIAWNSNDQLFETEHGPSGIWPNCCQDETNQIEKGGNYGWPDSVGDKVLRGTIGPLLHSNSDTWAPSGSTIIGNSLFFSGLRGQALYEYKISEKKLLQHFKNQFGRLREAVLGPDGMLYITTSNRDGRGTPQEGDDKIIKIDPAAL